MKHLRSAGHAMSLPAARTQAEVAKKASLDPKTGAEPWGLTTRDDGLDRYLGRFRDELVGGISTLLTASGVSDAARYHSARTGEDLEASRRHVTDLRRQFESEQQE